MKSEVERVQKIVALHDRSIRQRDELRNKCAFIRCATGLPGSPSGPPIMPDCLILHAACAGRTFNVWYLRCDCGPSEGVSVDQPPDNVRNSKYLATGSLTADPAAVRAMLDEAREFWTKLREQLKPKRDRWAFLNYLSRGK